MNESDPTRTTRGEPDPEVTIGSPPAAPTGAGAAGVPGYDIVGTLGRGGMGVVYRAVQAGLNRPVALKMLLAGAFADAGSRARFLLEAESVAALEHPHVVKVFAFGEHTGHPYLAMELVPGGSLAERIEAGGPLPATEAAVLLAKLAGAVAHAHSRGVVHRDIKPANVLLAADGEPRLTDFGLAKVGRHDRGLSETGQILGTPAYMAPEQAAGRVREVGTAADVYALGAVLYDLLTGRPPFQGDSAAVTLQKVLTEEPTRPRRHNPAIPRDLELICLTCLEKEPAKRYPTARALADDLDRFLRGEPIGVRGAGALERLIRRARRKPALVTAWGLGVLAAALATVGSAAAWLWRDSEAARSQLAAEKRQTDEARSAAEAARDVAARALGDSSRAEFGLRVADYANRVQLAYRLWQTCEFRAAREALAHCPAELRGWEWRYVERLCNPPAQHLRGHTAGVNAVAFHPDGARVATGSDDRTVRVWDAASGRELHRFEFPEPVLDAAFVPGRPALAVAHGQLVRLIDPETGAERATLRGHTGRVNRLAARRDGRELVTGSSDGTVRTWDAATGKELRASKPHGGAAVAEVAYLDAAGATVTAGHDGAQCWWDVGGNNIGRFPGRDGRPPRLAVVPNAARGRPAVFTSRGGGAEPGARDPALRAHLFLCDGEREAPWINFSPKPSSLLKGIYTEVPALAISEHGCLAAQLSGPAVGSAAFDEKLGRASVVRVFDWSAGGGDDYPFVFQAECGADVRRLAFSPDSDRLACAGGGGEVRVWPVGLRAAGRHYSVGDVNDGAFSPGGDAFALGTESFHTVFQMHVPSGREEPLTGHKATIQAVAYDPAGAGSASSAADGSVKLWRAAFAKDLKGGTGPIAELVFDQSGRRLIGLDLSGAVRVWDTASGATVRTHATERRSGGRHGVTFGPGGTMYAALTGADTVTVWDAARGDQVWSATVPRARRVWAADGGLLVVQGDTDVAAWEWAGFRERYRIRAAEPIGSCTVCPGGRLLATSGRSAIRLWSLATGEAVLEMQVERIEDAQLEFFPDGSRLVGVNSDARVRVWETVTGRQVFQFPPCYEVLRWARVSPDGSCLAVGGDTVLWLRSAPLPDR